MAREIEARIVVVGDKDAETGFRLPVEATPEELVPYLLRDLGLPKAVENRRCFYRFRIRSAGRSMFSKAGDWIELLPGEPIEAQIVPDAKLWELEVSEPRGAGVHQAPRVVGGALPPDPDPKTLRKSGKRNRAEGRAGGVDLDAPPPSAAAPDPSPAPAPAPPRQDTRPARVVTVVVTRPTDDSFASHREDLLLNLTGDQLAEQLGAQYQLASPPRGELWIRPPDGTWSRLDGGEVLGHRGLDDGHEVRIGPERSQPDVGADEVRGTAPRPGPDVPDEPPRPSPRATTPLWLWALLFLLALVLGLGALYALRPKGPPGGAGTGTGALPMATAAPASDTPTVSPTGSAPPGTAAPTRPAPTEVHAGNVTPVRVSVPPGQNPVPPAPGCRVDGQPVPCDMALAFDGRHDTAWCFGESEIGRVSVPIPLPPGTGALVGFSVLNGYQKRDELAGGKDRWQQNHRVGSVVLHGAEYLLADDRAQQFVALREPVTAPQVTFAVTGIHRGAGGASADVCVSEVQLGAAR